MKVKRNHFPAPPPQLAKRFDDVVRAFELDQPDLELSAKNLAAKHRSWGLRSSNGANHISPENVITMPLGAALYTTSSLFDRRSIFDMGALRTESLIPNLNGQSESGITSQISSKSGKDDTGIGRHQDGRQCQSLHLFLRH
jgi:hypothetical protein